MKQHGLLFVFMFLTQTRGMERCRLWFSQQMKAQGSLPRSFRLSGRVGRSGTCWAYHLCSFPMSSEKPYGASEPFRSLRSGRVREELPGTREKAERGAGLGGGQLRAFDCHPRPINHRNLQTNRDFGQAMLSGVPSLFHFFQGSSFLQNLRKPRENGAGSWKER